MPKPDFTGIQSKCHRKDERCSFQDGLVVSIYTCPKVISIQDISLSEEYLESIYTGTHHWVIYNDRKLEITLMVNSKVLKK